ncbi:MAG: hypothetical protein QOG54_232 [Actinomycetota bacterium]|nr:hypothetical protein [Actinomycetota bacterium]
MGIQDDPVIAFASQAKFAAWLAKEHSKSDGIWLKLAKKNSGIPSLTHDEALDIALRYGWIDGQAKSVDDAYWVQRFTPRRARSKWSKKNATRAEELIASGEMKPAGLREVERAKADGRWDAAYDPPSKISVPPDLQKELDRSKKARDFFASLNSTNRYAILYRIQDAKKPETRARRIEKFVAMLKAGEKLHP